MTNPVTPHDDSPGLVEEEGVQSTAAAAGRASPGPDPAEPVDPETEEAPPGDALLGPAGGQPQPGQELAAGEG